MANVWMLVLVGLCVTIVGNLEDVTAEAPREMSPKAAQQYVADSEKAANGDPDAAFRMGQALESGRFGGLKDLNKALSYYRLAARNGHPDAATRITQIEADLRQSQKKEPPASK